LKSKEHTGATHTDEEEGAADESDEDTGGDGELPNSEDAAVADSTARAAAERCAALQCVCGATVTELS
jgi:hypothetical protein